MGLLSRLFATHGNVDTSPLSDFWFSEIGTLSKTGVNISAESAMRISPVYQGVRLMSQIVGMLPLFMFRRRPDGGKDKDRQHDNHRLLHDMPNKWQTAMQFRQQMQALAMLHGDAFAEIVPGPRTGWRDELIPLNPTKVKVEQLATGRLRYVFTRDDGTPKPLNQDQVFHLPGFGTNGVTGFSMIKQFRETAGLALATEDYGSAFFGKSAVPRVVLKHPGKPSRDAKKRIATSWNEAYGGLAGSQGTAILEEDMDVTTLGVDNEKSQFLETRKFIVTEFARWLNVSPHMLADLDRATFNNVEEMGLALVIYQAMPHIVQWEQAIFRDLLTEEEHETHFAEHIIDGLVRGDIKTRYESFRIAVETGWMTRNEVRERDNLNPKPGLDAVLQPLNFTTVPSAQAMAVAKAAAARVLEKEKTRLARWAERKANDGDGWAEFVQKFYARHHEFVRDVLSIDGVTANAYCQRQCDAVLDGGMAAVSRWGEAKEMELVILALWPSEQSLERKDQ